jgi:hypothetical protein
MGVEKQGVSEILMTPFVPPGNPEKDAWHLFAMP